MSYAPNNLGPVEIRVLGCLIEKQRTTPDTYPLTLNALRLACNQSTNRDPVVSYDEDEIHDALQQLYRRELTRAAGGHSSRSSKYRHLVPDRLGIDDAQQALLAVLLLRGAQTPGELKSRTERLYGFEDLDALEATLSAMIGGGLVERLERRPGEKQVRYRQLMGEDADDAAEAVGSPSAVAPEPHAPSELEARVERLEQEVAELRARLPRP
jgi:uncharacterized protein YceH (UPF0502 family)